MPTETLREWTRRIKADYFIPAAAFFSIFGPELLMALLAVATPHIYVYLKHKDWAHTLDVGSPWLITDIFKRGISATLINLSIESDLDTLFATVSSPLRIVTITFVNTIFAVFYVIYMSYLVNWLMLLGFATASLGLITLDFFVTFSFTEYTNSWLFKTDSDPAQHTNGNPLNYLHIALRKAAWKIMTYLGHPEYVVAVAGIIASNSSSTEEGDTGSDTAISTPSTPSSSLSAASKKQLDFIFTVNHDDHVLVDEDTDGSATSSLLSGPQTGEKRPAEVINDGENTVGGAMNPTKRSRPSPPPFSSSSDRNVDGEEGLEDLAMLFGEN